MQWAFLGRLFRRKGRYCKADLAYTPKDRYYLLSDDGNRAVSFDPPLPEMVNEEEIPPGVIPPGYTLWRDTASGWHQRYRPGPLPKVDPEPK